MLTGSILQQLRDAHQGSQSQGKRPLNFGVYYKNTLVALCHALEDSILEHDYSPLMITAFQRGKWYLQEADRYGQIAEKSPQIVILAADDAGFAEHPTSQRDNVALVSLEDADPVAQEWHLIIVSPDYTAMVLCQELAEADYLKAGVPTHDLERKFYGLWTFEPSLVLETAELAIAHIGRYNPQLQQQLTQQLSAIAAQVQQVDALCSSPTADNLGDIVTRVVDYLQTHQAADPQAEFRDRFSVNDNLISNELQAYLRIAQLIDLTDLSNPMAAAEVATLTEAMGNLLDLPAWQLHRLQLASLLHRIARIESGGPVLSPGASSRYDEDATVPLACPLIPGTQLLRRMNRLKAIATILAHHTERWDGRGYPAGLRGDEIPLESRILGLAIAFQAHVTHLNAQPSADPLQNLTIALDQCKAEQGQQWDPKLVETLSLLIAGIQQGLSLPAALPKIASGLWLLDSHSEEDVLGLSQLSSPVEAP
ncbi:metal-dependent phosphohydrolase [Thermoleptolyngbya sichuanensis A183]|uniref:Metal-dependent phosphohydrolase n=1 Tax=Thermoleptolyngbya sichuanensis A183 TaxID=2737172 RepID=A0A6M8BPR5_9CYAN|nr:MULTISPECIES: DICT sensory domain-containing protein [Thermoleptolyngbya]QKD84315.1 metal-dependent phosphohydrolase [Thermoleptolyngbya sichuanensis A183]